MTPTVRINRNNQDNLKKCLVFYAGILLCMYRPGICTGAKCGRPGRTAISIYNPPGRAFQENDTIRYICTESNHIVLGNSERRCLKDGSWSDDIPLCSKMSVLHRVQLLYQNFEEENNTTVDGDKLTCLEPSEDNPTTWSGYLPKSVNVSAVQVSFKGPQEVDIDVAVQEEDSSLVRRCKFKSGSAVLSSKSISTLTFHCPAATVAKYIHLSYHNQYLSVCEVRVLLPTASACVSPDIPLHGIGFKTISEEKSMYQFTCQPGYKLWGEIMVTCQEDGRWLPKSPVCEEIFCRAPEPLKNGRVDYDSNNGRIPYNGVARYVCKDGFYLSGSSERRCHRWYEWDYPSPLCEPVTRNAKQLGTSKTKGLSVTEGWEQSNVTHCGSLPQIANGALIVNSSNIGSIAWLKCTEGFKPLTDDNVTCLPSGKWSSQSLHCTAIQCEANPVTPNGRVIMLNNSSYYGSSLQVKCNQGYGTHNTIIRKCNEFGTWGDLNVCIEITCEAISIEKDSFGQWLPVNGSNSLHVLICPENFHIEGSPAVIRCLSNGSWSYTSAQCKKSFYSLWGSNWTPSLMLIVAVAAGIATAIFILCLSVVFLVIKKRRQTQTNTTIFHLENASEKDTMRKDIQQRQKHYSAAEYYNAVQRRNTTACTNPRKPRSALPNLPVDADPVYAQPFETAVKKISTGSANRKDDLYNAHIYAEPVDSRKQTPTHILINIENSRMGTERRLSTMKASIRNEPPRSFTTDQQNCNRKCAIYDSSGSSSLNSGQLVQDENFQNYNEKIEFSTLAKNLDYLELL